MSPYIYAPREGCVTLRDGTLAREGDWVQDTGTGLVGRIGRIELHTHDTHTPEFEQTCAWLHVPDIADSVLVPPEVLQRDYVKHTP